MQAKKARNSRGQGLCGCFNEGASNIRRERPISTVVAHYLCELLGFTNLGDRNYAMWRFDGETIEDRRDIA